MRGETGTMRRGYQPNYLGKDEWGKSVGIPVVRVARPSGSAARLRRSKLAIRRQTLPSPDRVLKKSAFDLMTDPGVLLSDDPRRRIIINDISDLGNLGANSSGFGPDMTTGEGRRVERSRRRTHQPTACQPFFISPLKLDGHTVDRFLEGMASTKRLIFQVGDNKGIVNISEAERSAILDFKTRCGK